MIRVCPNCKKEIEFKIKSMSELNSLTCPECGAKIPADSRIKDDTPPEKETSAKIGYGLAALSHFGYIFYFLISIVGMVLFFLKLYTALYVCTGIAVFAFIMQWIIGYMPYRWTAIFPPIGAIAGFFIFKSIPGVCFGVMAGFFLRHLIKDIIYKIVWAIIGWVRSCR